MSLIFFIANAGLAIGSIARGRSATKPSIACALPILCVVLPLVLEPIFVHCALICVELTNSISISRPSNQFIRVSRCFDARRLRETL